MAKMRIYDIARSMQEKLPDIKSKDVVKLLQENGFEAKSAQSVIEDDAIGFLLKHFNKVVAQKAAKKENTKNSKPVKQNKTSNQEHKPKAANTNKKNKEENAPYTLEPEATEPKATEPKAVTTGNADVKEENDVKPVLKEEIKKETIKEETVQKERPQKEEVQKKEPQKENLQKDKSSFKENIKENLNENKKDVNSKGADAAKESQKTADTAAKAGKPGIEKETKENSNDLKQETANGKRDNMNQNGQNNNKNNNNRNNGNNNRDNRDNKGQNQGNGRGGNNKDNRRNSGQERNTRDNRNDRNNNRNDRDNNRNDSRGDNRGNRDNRGRDNRNNQSKDGRGFSQNRGGGNRDNRGGGRDNRGGSPVPMDSMKSEVKQSRQQRANKDSRSAKQKYGKGHDREDLENDIFMQPKNRKKKDPDRRGAFIKPEPVAKPAEPEDGIKTIVLPEKMTIKELSDTMKVQASTVIKNLFMRGQVVTLNHEITFEEAEEIALEYNCIAEQEEKVDLIAEILKEDEEDEALMKQRPPVVCVMGHVDHGKTSLLDAIRETHVTSREAGGITQHIGAYVTEINGNSITFLDTPGHEAFTSMRMRGAQSTDIAILVVAADDGVMPQTVEAISHAKAAGVEVIVAVNKIDKPSANVERVKQELVEYGLVAEDWGGDTIFVPVSAHTKEGIENLLEMIILTAVLL